MSTQYLITSTSKPKTPCIHNWLYDVNLKQIQIGLVLIGSITVKGAFRRIFLHAKFQLTTA